MDSRRASNRKRRTEGKSVGGRLAVFLVLMVVMVLGMYFAYRASQWLDERSEKTPEKAAATEPEPTGPKVPEAPPVETPTADTGTEGTSDAEATPPADAEPKRPLTPDEKKAAMELAKAKADAARLGAEDAEQLAAAAAKAEAEYKAVAWPREADLPILKRYDIDWRKGNTLFEDVRDGNYEFEGSVTDAAAFYWLLNVVAKLPREAFRPDLPGEETSFKRLLELPNSYRGVPVTIEGALASVNEAEFPRPDVAGREKFWIIDLYEPRKRGSEAEFHTLIVLDPPEPLKTTTTIRAKGYFFKIRSYDSPGTDEYGDENIYTYKCPVLIGRYVEEVEGGALVHDNQGDVLLLLTVVGFGALAAMVFFFLRRMQARQGVYRKAPGQGEDLADSEIGKRVAFLGDIESGDAPPGEAMGDRQDSDE